MNHKMADRFTIFNQHFAGIVFLLILAIFIIILLFRFPISSNSLSVNFSAGWRDVNGKPISLTNFTFGDDNTPTTHAVYKTISSVPENTLLLFYARNMYVDIYANSKLVSSDTLVTNRLYGTSPGIRWHYAVLEASDLPVIICIKGTAVYPDAAGLINDIFLGTPQDVLYSVFAKHLPTFLFSTVLLLLSVSFFTLYACFRSRYHMGKDFLLLGTGLFFTSLWCSMDTRMWQFFFGNSEVFHVITYISFFMIPLSFLLLAANRFQYKLRFITNCFISICAVSVLGSFILHFTGLLEFHYTIKLNHVLIILMIPFLIKLILSYQNDESSHMNNFLFTTVIITLIVCLTTAFLRYGLGYYDDNSTYVQIALVGFLICLVTYHINLMAQLFKSGAKADMLHHLALTDHMSGLYNRTAFSERRADYEDPLTAKSKVGIIQFDVNNLKITNDNFGHEHGDRLIQIVSEGIRKSFSDKGDCYRMGGDEFMVVLTGKNPSLEYKKGLAQFLSYCEEQNTNPDIVFPLEVAYGYMLDFSLPLSDVMDLADIKMYENKNLIKSHKTKGTIQ